MFANTHSFEATLQSETDCEWVWTSHTFWILWVLVAYTSSWFWSPTEQIPPNLQRACIALLASVWYHKHHSVSVLTAIMVAMSFPLLYVSQLFIVLARLFAELCCDSTHPLRVHIPTTGLHRVREQPQVLAWEELTRNHLANLWNDLTRGQILKATLFLLATLPHSYGTPAPVALEVMPENVTYYLASLFLAVPLMVTRVLLYTPTRRKWMF